MGSTLVTEYRRVSGVCACGQSHRRPFPAAVSAPVQDGAGLMAFAVYLTHNLMCSEAQPGYVFDQQVQW
jgi:hypothetical protein